MKVGKVFKFEAAHKIVNHPGKCANEHGHSYKLEVVVEGDVHPYSGMVADFDYISKYVQAEIIDVVDHHNLNTVLPNLNGITTAENLVNAFYDMLKDSHLSICMIRLWETDTCYAEA